MNEQIKTKLNEYKANNRRCQTARAAESLKGIFPAAAIFAAAVEWHKEIYHFLDGQTELCIKVALGLAEPTYAKPYDGVLDSADAGYPVK
jgi:hypothetical protein